MFKVMESSMKSIEDHFDPRQSASIFCLARSKHYIYFPISIRTDHKVYQGKLNLS